MFKETISQYRRILVFVKPYWRILFLAMLFMSGVALCTASLAFLVQPALDGIFVQKNYTMLLIIPVAILIAYAMKGVLNFSQEYFMNYAGQKIVMDIRQKLYEHTQKLSLNYFVTNPVGDLASRVTNDVFTLQSAVSRSLTSLIKEFFTAIGLMAVVFYRDWRLASIAFTVIPLIMIPIFRYGHRAKHYSYKGQSIMGDMFSFLKEFFTGIRIVKIFNLESLVTDRFRDENIRFFKNYMKQIKVRSISGPIIDMLAACAISGVIWYGGKEVISGHSTPGNFFSFITALLLMYEPIKKMNASFGTIQEGLGAANRIFEILDLDEEPEDTGGAIEIGEFREGIEFRHVSFRYDRDYVLKDFSLDVRKGDKIGIVGFSGSGKSTLVNLIPRFYEVQEGEIVVDGIDINRLSLKSLRRQIAMVTQEVILFNTTVKENIEYGKLSSSFDEVQDAAKHAYAHDFITKMPQGYETVIGEMGELLSGGERQRLAIARAFIKNAPILILDEATSALDSRSEQEVQNALNHLMEGRTCFIIAHRLSTLAGVDRIIVLKNGSILESGSHEELMEKRGQYYKLQTIQQQSNE